MSLSTGEKSHIVTAVVRMPVEIVFKFYIDDDGDTVRDIEGEAKIIAEARIDELLKEIDDDRITRVSVGDGRLKSINNIEKFGAPEEFETMKLEGTQ